MIPLAILNSSPDGYEETILNNHSGEHGPSYTTLTLRKILMDVVLRPFILVARQKFAVRIEGIW